MQSSRRKFISSVGKATAAAMIIPTGLRGQDAISTELLQRKEKYTANDHINLALIGAGGMGLADTNTALQIPGVKLVAVCDLYQERLVAAKKLYGEDIMVTDDFQKILARKDIDAVIVATPDHWHKDISVAAMQQGKSVYCEKPMVHSVSEGNEVVEAQKKYKVVFQVGSQGLSSLGNEKAKELLAQGAIGKLNYAEGFWARNSPEGAWQYPIPQDASEKNVNWQMFLHKYPQIPFDARRFFRWRCYRDYGTGVSGDLFVHLFSSLHFITNSAGPEKIAAMGGIRHWKDGREVPDILIGMFDYPDTSEHAAFNLSLRVNFVDGTASSTYLRLVGNEGSMDVEWDKVTLKRNTSYDPVDDPLRNTKLTRGTNQTDRKKILPPDTMVYEVEKGYRGAHYDHFYNFFTAVRQKTSVVEDALFGYRAAAPALLCNDSYFQNKFISWDPVNLKLR
jgi:predicted dehydrogenase